MSKRSHLFITALFFITGCATARHSIPPEFLTSARVYGMQDIRAFGGIPSDSFRNDFVSLLAQGKKNGPFFLSKDVDRTYSILAISGGAADGAYGAGLLTGWTKEGSRPVFAIVTGISTGAIIAPMAFLGSKYDDRLKEFYTTYSTKDIVRIRLPIINSLARTEPLERLIEHYFDVQLLKEIAAEYNKGRRLYVGTTNLDAQRLVIWDMGKIAAIGDANALKLFRKIILASASIPVAFPPVYLTVEAGGMTYDEMHVDGGITRQVFFLYDVLQGFDRALRSNKLDVSKIIYKIYVIRNGYVEPFYKEVPDKLFAIAERAVDTTINAQGVGDLYRLYYFSKRGRGDFNLAYISATHASQPKELFDLARMRELFELGFEEALRGYPWKKSPPGLGEVEPGDKQ